MNELIMAALENAKIQFSSFTMGDKEMILDVVKFVCKAQRNACWREYIDMVVFRKPGESEDYIKNAEIRKEDYE